MAAGGMVAVGGGQREVSCRSGLLPKARPRPRRTGAGASPCDQILACEATLAKHKKPWCACGPGTTLHEIFGANTDTSGKPPVIDA